MSDVVSAMELRGQAGPVEGREGALRAHTGGRGPLGETVRLTSEVVLTGETFQERGRISYSGRGAVQFVTVGAGSLGPSPLPETQWGAVIWRVTGGDGACHDVSGSMTSNCTVPAGGEVVDHHDVRLV